MSFGLKTSRSILRFEVLSLTSHGSFLVKAPFFFFMIVALFPIALGPMPNMLAQASGGIIIVSLLLACLLPINQFFDKDGDNGLLSHMMMAPIPFGWIVFLKICAHWMVAALPMVILSPFVALSLRFGDPLLMLYVMFPASILFVMIGVLSASVTFGAKSGDVLLALLALPLYIPVVICAYFALQGQGQGHGQIQGQQAFGDYAGADLASGLSAPNAQAGMYFLYAGLVLALPLVPLACSKILRASHLK